MPMYEQNALKNSILEQKKMILKLCIQHLGLRIYKLCSNDDYVLTLTYFMARSTLLPNVLYGKTFYRTVEVYKLEIRTCS